VSTREDADTHADVVVLTASDEDAGDSLTWSVTEGTASCFTFGTGGRLVLDDCQLDYETTNKYTLTVKVADVAGASDTATVSVTVLDVNEAPAVALLPSPYPRGDPQLAP